MVARGNETFGIIAFFVGQITEKIAVTNTITLRLIR